eukprot:TRINITY_DN3936_c0_g1_i1.p1 TRINITY_DN3936_c0_g1~~TRINITY_DN3936_c0_g1_i1.p1  ORF type:complete len:200 (-),score=17.82 TRINITY_DN3936_c0_g1_i1:125-724(-)
MTYLRRPTIVKERFSKKYRHPDLDVKLTAQRVSWEVKSMMKCRKMGIDTPAIYLVDQDTNRIFMEHIEGITVKEFLFSLENKDHDDLDWLASSLGQCVAQMHDAGIVHGDLTTSNFMLRSPSNSLVVIDFGLSYNSNMPEDKAVDLYVLERAFISTHPSSEQLFSRVLEAYKQHSKHSTVVLQKLNKVRARGRKRTMIG